MIVNAVEKGWEIIYHRGHALLAAELAAHWRAADRPERWIETLAAIMQHDDMEREREAEDHLTPIDRHAARFHDGSPDVGRANRDHGRFAISRAVGGDAQLDAHELFV
mgnify:CR=1 FL=1